jgi:hypothetical protein
MQLATVQAQIFRLQQMPMSTGDTISIKPAYSGVKALHHLGLIDDGNCTDVDYKGSRSVTSSLPVINVTLYAKDGTSIVLPMAIDTGSSATWFRGIGCTSPDKSCGEPGEYAIDGNKYFQAVDRNGTIKYGKGLANARVFTGKVGLSKNFFSSIAVGVSTYQKDLGDQVAGVLGLSFHGKYNQPFKSNRHDGNFFRQLNFKKGSPWIFSIFQSNNEGNVTTDWPSEIMFGGYNTERFTGHITYMSVQPQKYYAFGSKFWVISSPNGGAGTQTFSDREQSIADSGTDIMIFNKKEIVENIHQNLIGIGEFDAGTNLYLIDCGLEGTSNAPDLLFTYSPPKLGQRKLKYKKQQKKLRITIPSNVYVKDLGDGRCYSAIAFLDIPGVPHIWGNTFLSQAYTIYDRANHEVGFAQAVHNV